MYFRENINIINHFMKERNINFELQGRVRKYLEFNKQIETNSAKETKIINQLTHALKREVFLEFNGKHLMNIPIFRDNFSSNTIEELSFVLRKNTYSPEEYVFHVKITYLYKYVKI